MVEAVEGGRWEERVLWDDFVNAGFMSVGDVPVNRHAND